MYTPLIGASGAQRITPVEHDPPGAVAGQSLGSGEFVCSIISLALKINVTASERRVGQYDGHRALVRPVKVIMDDTIDKLESLATAFDIIQTRCQDIVAEVEHAVGKSSRGRRE